MREELMDWIHECAGHLSEHGYGENDGTVLELIDICQSAIEQSKGELGPWEQAILDYARTAAKEHRLMLALMSAQKALQISDLPQDEYEFGFKYGGNNL
jgi:hypothetical protein